MTEVRGRTTRACARTRSACDGLWHNGQVSRPHPLHLGREQGSTPAVEPGRAVVGRRLRRAPRPTGRSRCPARARGRSGCAACARDTCGPRTARCQPGSIATTPGPQKLKSPATIAVRPRARQLRPQRRGGGAAARASTAATTSARPRRRPRCRARRSCTAARTADRRDRRGSAPIGSSRRARIGNREQIASSQCPSPGSSCRERRLLMTERRELDRLDVVAVVDEIVEHAAAVVLAPRLEHHDDVGVEAAHDLARRRSGRRWCAPKRPTPQCALNEASVKSVRRISVSDRDA